ncbi:hypothetical protein FSP39_021082 [Pinctada imbricata]|uniref:Gem-associated protein 5 n=1 Tax=Pinctada imbricata TaxID=66713 RepID=A0AA88Y9D8_PINIB|nr:hypothetical protein FSP39_021082 [Pinctada imbricata]
MAELVLPPSPHWYCSQAIDINSRGLIILAARHAVFIMDGTVNPPLFRGSCNLHYEKVTAIRFSCLGNTDSLCCSGAEDGKIIVWDSTNPKEALACLDNHTSKVICVGWSPFQSNVITSASDKGEITVCHYPDNRAFSFCPESSHVICMEYSPIRENLLAIGYKAGHLLIVDIKREGHIVHKLRGHDEEVQSIAWCPIAGENFKGKKEEYEDLDNPRSLRELQSSESADFGTEGQLLISGSKDKTLRLWSTSTGRQVLSCKLPKASGLTGKELYAARMNIWTAVVWSKNNPYHVICSSYGGEILQLDLSVSGNQRWQSFTSLDRKMAHSRLVFNLGIGGPGNTTLVSSSLDRQLIIWDIEDKSARCVLPTLGGFVYIARTCCIDPGRLALGVGDGMIRLWNLNNTRNKVDITTLWQGIKSKVTALCWHPEKESLLAYGTDDGRVGIYDTLVNKPPSISSHYHRRTVYVVAWGPSVSNNAEQDSSYVVYSIGDGTILSHDPHNLQEEAVDVNRIIENVNGKKPRQLVRSEISWCPDFSLVAVGNDDGSVEILRPPDLKLVCCIHIHHKLINSLQWHPIHTTVSSSTSAYRYYMASGSNESAIQIVDLTSAIENKTETEAVLITQPKVSLLGHSHRITNLQWSPHDDLLIASVSYDGTARVWDVSTGQMIGCYHGHMGRLLCIQWSGFEADMLYSGGEDFTLQKWNYKKHPPTAESKDTKRRKKTKANKKKYVIPQTKGENHVTEGSGEDITKVGEQKIDSASGVLKLDPNSQETPPAGGAMVLQSDDQSELSDLLESRKLELLKQANSEQELQTSDSGRLEDFWSVYNPEEHISIGFFIKDRRAIIQTLDIEGQHHRDNDNMDYYYQLEIWKGNINGALRLAREREELSDWLVAMAPMAAFDTWIVTCQDYAAQLEGEGQYHKAATYLLAAHKVYEALELFKRHRLFKEAIALAKVRLSPFDPVLEDLYMLWAHQLTKDGNYEQAAKCHLAMRQVKDAALLLARRYNCQSSVKTAARISLVASERQQGMVYAHRILHQHLLQAEWEEAQQFLTEQKAFQGLLAVTGMHELITKELMEYKVQSVPVIDQSKFTNWKSRTASKIIIPDFILDMQDTDPISPWKPRLIEGHTFPHHVLRVWYSYLSIAMDTENIEDMYKSLSVLHAGKQSQEEISQLLVQVSMDLVLCLLSLLMSETPTAISHLLHAVSSLHEAGHLKVMETVLRLFLPQGPKYMLKLQQEITAMRVVISMESRSDYDGASKVHTIKRYLSEIKDEDSVSCGGIRCRELDCLRAYYYLAILEYLRNKLRNQDKEVSGAEVKDMLQEQTIVPSTGALEANGCKEEITNIVTADTSQTGGIESVTGPSGDNTASETSEDKDKVNSDNNMHNNSEVKIETNSVTEEISVVKEKGKTEDSTETELPTLSRENGQNCEASSSGSQRQVSASVRPKEIPPVWSVTGEGSSVDADPLRLFQTNSTVSVPEDVSGDKSDSNVHIAGGMQESQNVTDEKGDNTPNLTDTDATDKSVNIPSQENQPYCLTLMLLSQLSRGLLWDIQGKRYALIETLGYIHKAISQLLLAQKPNSLSATAQSETLQTHTEAHEYSTQPHEYSSQVSRDISSFSEAEPNVTLQEHVHNHEQLDHALSNMSGHACKKRHNSEPVPPAKSSVTNPHMFHHQHHSHMEHVHSYTRSVSAETHSLDFHIHHEHVCPAHENLDSSNENPLDLCTSCEWISKSRKVLWEDEPVHQLGVEHAGKGKPMSIINPAKYINTPDEWYNMSADQKYSKSYVTMAILKEEQEYMMNELKRGPDAIQAPFPNPMDSVRLLLDVCQSSQVLTNIERQQFTERAVTWALRFSVTTQQKDLLMELLHKMTPH